MVVAASGQAHWDGVYRNKPSEGVSWYRPHLERSLTYVSQVAPELSSHIIDVGGGTSTLVDDLLAKGYFNLTVLDVAPTAIEVARKRLGARAQQVSWLVADILKIELPKGKFDLWHDRAVFHFLMRPDERSAYVRQVARAVKPGGHVLVASFGPEGPEKCSGLDVVRYDSKSLHKEFGVGFRLLLSSKEMHETPMGTVQQFLYCLCRIE